MFYVCLRNVGLHAILGPTCNQLELTWGHVGPTLDRLGPNLGPTCANSSQLGANVDDLGATFDQLWTHLVLTSAILCSNGGHETSEK